MLRLPRGQILPGNQSTRQPFRRVSSTPIVTPSGDTIEKRFTTGCRRRENRFCFCRISNYIAAAHPAEYDDDVVAWFVGLLGGRLGKNLVEG